MHISKGIDKQVPFTNKVYSMQRKTRISHNSVSWETLLYFCQSTVHPTLVFQKKPLKDRIDFDGRLDNDNIITGSRVYKPVNVFLTLLTESLSGRNL